MGLLGRDEILQADDLAVEDVEVPEWGGTVRVRTMTGAERDVFEQSVITRRGKKVDVIMRDMRAKLVALCLIDDEGEILFSESDVRALSNKSALALNRVFEVAQRLNGLTETDIEELTGNFQIGQNGDSISD